MLANRKNTHEGSREAGGREQRDACVQTMATSETGAEHDKSGWCFVETSISTGIFELLVNTSSEVSNEEYVLAVVTDDQEGEDATTTDSDGDVSPKWLKMCKKRSKKKAMRTEDQETLDLNAGHKVIEEKITIKGHAHKRVREWRIRELVRSSGQRIEDTARRSRSRRRGGSAQSTTFRLEDVTKALASVNKFCRRRNRVACKTKKAATSRTRHRDRRCPCVLRSESM